MRLKGLLTAKGVHYLITRFGPAWLRSLAFDEKYQRGDWDFHGEGGEMKSIVSKYLRGGDLLMLGCGSASVLEGLESSAFSSVLGVDLSEEGLRRARRFCCERISFEVGDMIEFQCPKPYDLILLSECLYYVRSSVQVDMLKRYSAHLKTGGVFAATFAQPKRYEEIIERIRKNFSVVEDRPFSGSARHLIVFNSSPK